MILYFFIIFIMQFEGFHHYSYYDISDYKHIGIGHKITEKEIKTEYILVKNKKIYYKNGLTDSQIVDIFMSDIFKCTKLFEKEITVELNNNQYVAIGSLCYNIGITAFKNSTLLKKLNKEKFYDIPNEFRKWVYIKNNKVTALINRREKEIKLWNSME